MLSVVLTTADVPVVRLHGLLSARVVPLSQEVNLVLGDLRQVATTVVNHLCDSLESRTSPYSLRAARFHEVRLVAQINAVTRITRSCCATVRRKQHSTMFVRLFLATLAQCAGYIVNTGLPCYFCHSFSLGLMVLLILLFVGRDSSLGVPRVNQVMFALGKA